MCRAVRFNFQSAAAAQPNLSSQRARFQTSNSQFNLRRRRRGLPKPSTTKPMAAKDSGDGGGEKMVTLVSSDGARFEVPESAASLSQTVRRMMGEATGGDGPDGGGISLPGVDGRTLCKVLEYCIKHAPVPGQEESSSAEAAAAAKDPGYAEDLELEWYDREFMRVDRATLYALVAAADYLKVQGLLDLTCKSVADMMRGKTPEQIREVFGIESDFTPEEEEQVRRENAWAFH